MRGLVKAVCLIVVLGLAVTACGKKSRLEGKVVDGKGKPIAGMKIIAKQAKAVKGEEQFLANAAADGLFSFDSLHPSSDYILIPTLSDIRFGIAKVPIRSALAGDKVVMEPMVLRFIFNQDGLIVDSITGLEWRPDVLQYNMKFAAAVEFTKNLVQGEHTDWRLPTRAELKSLYDPAMHGKFKIYPMFHLTDCCAWTGELKDEGSAWGFNFVSGNEIASPFEKPLRALAVRTRK